MNFIKRVIASSLCVFVLFSCSNKTNTSNANEDWVANAIHIAADQSKDLAKAVKSTGKLPRSVKDGQVRVDDLYDWTSGFFPGTLWYLYELTGDKKLMTEAEEYTALLHDVQFYKDNHDVGFMMMCSYGNQLRLVPSDSIPSVLVNTAESLCSRYKEEVGAIRSWDFGEWNYPVIIDNMMNLDLLFWASKYTQNNKYRDIAIKHADKTLEHHFRDDMSSYHVISYNNDGTVESKGTHQGYADDSSWARGQAWAVYGMVVMYRETKDTKYLKAAEDIAKLIMELPTMPSDNIPYWDYNAPNIPDAPRDVSAATVTASALLELSTMIADGGQYFDYAESILQNVSKAPYLADRGTNHGFILKHSVGHLPANSEIDTPLNYADYYYVESLKRYMDLKGIKYPIK